MASVFFTFFIELFAFRWDTARMQPLSGGKVTHKVHARAYGPGGMPIAHGSEGEMPSPIPVDVEAGGMVERKARHSPTCARFHPTLDR
jgi:hypothetical protein